jgi:outer membrane protein assembly complex protein YaeT
VVIVSVLIGSSLPARGGVEEYEGLTVSTIRFDPPQQPIGQDEIRSLLPFREGAALRGFDVRVAIERLSATGRYTQITVHAERDGSGVAVRFETQGTWFTGRVAVEGVPEPPNRGQLVSATKLVLGAPFNEDDIRAASENLKAKLEANGFFEARIAPLLERDAATQQVFVEFRVTPGPRARFTMPGISGAPADRVKEIVRATHWQRFWGFGGWKPVTESRTSVGLDRVKRSLAKSDFLQSKITLDNLAYLSASRRVLPELTIDIGPKIAVRTEGAKVSRGRLRQLVPIYQEQSADRDLIIEGMRNLTDHFRSQGYFEAKVDFSTETEPDGTRAVTYTVERGERFKLASMLITGNRYFSQATLRERMLTTPATRIRYRRGRFSESLVRADLDALRDLYLTNGFRSPSFTHTVDRSTKGKSNWLHLRIDIQEGPQTLVSHRTVDGVSEVHRAAVGGLLTSEPGQPFSEANIVADRDAVLAYYYNNGYPDAAFDWQSAPSTDPEGMEVRFTVQEGRRQFVRDFLIGGLETSDPEMVQRRIRLSPGEPLSQLRMVESQRRLYDLGVFARVDAAIQNPDGLESGKYLLYQFEEARRYSLNFGLGAEIARIGSGSPNFDAPAGQPGFSPRASLGVSRSNFAGTGHTLALQTRFSNIQQRALLTYLAPQFKGYDSVTLTISGLYDLSRDIRTFQARRQEGSVQLAHRVRKDLTLQGRFSYRRNTISNLLIDDALIPVFTRPGRVGVVSTTLIQDRRDSPIDSRRGFYNTFDFGFASKAFASQTDYARILARNSSYHRVVRDVVFARSIAVGWLHALDEGGAAAIPLPERFFAGGASSHRGFPENQAGPRDLRTGFPLGGSGLLTNNLELRFPLVGDTLGGVFFHDAGNIYSTLGNVSLHFRQRDPASFDYMVHAVGFGFRYRTPVGPVRIDLAYSANSPRFEFERREGFVPVTPRTIVSQRINQFQFHFSLGQTF